MPVLNIAITGTSVAISRVVKSVIDRSPDDYSCEVLDMDRLILSAQPINADCVVLNDFTAGDNYSLPFFASRIPAVLITANEKILSNPRAYGLVAAIRNSSGGTAGMAVFSENLYNVLKTISEKRGGKVCENKPFSEPKRESFAKINIDYHRTPLHPAASKNGIELIAIGASTGGTDAIIEVVQNLPADIPPIVIVQHMPEGFTKMYADRLDRICKMRAKEAEDGDRLESGLIILGHGSRQLEVHKDARGYYVTSRPGAKVSGHCPSVDVLFSSVAKAAGKSAIGVLLTGMGRDGATGLGEMRRSGAFTIGQDEPTCVVYGMPCVAYNEGAVVRQAPLQEICGIILENL